MTKRKAKLSALLSNDISNLQTYLDSYVLIATDELVAKHGIHKVTGMCLTSSVLIQIAVNISYIARGGREFLPDLAHECAALIDKRIEDVLKEQGINDVS